jgi:predicted DNA-binding transcriptional regulator YafY
MRVMPAPITAARLAEETGVSLRSLYRDIDGLRAAGARIEGERGYGYRLIEDYALPPQTFDRLEIEAIALGLAEVRNMVYRPDARHLSDTDVEVLRNACWQEETLLIRYRDKNERTSERSILPLSLVYTERTLTVLAWCCLRAAFRMFRAERISNIQPTGMSFRPRRIALLREYMTQLQERSKHRPATGSTSTEA